MVLYGAGGGFPDYEYDPEDAAGGANNPYVQYINKGDSYGNQAVGYFETALAPFFNAAKSDVDYFGQAAIGQQQSILDMIPQQFREARSNVSSQGRAATQGIMDAQTQALGASQQM